MSRSQVELCPPTCVCWHSKQFVMEQLGIRPSSLYKYIREKNGLRISRKGMIWCPWIREFWEREVDHTSP